MSYDNTNDIRLNQEKITNITIQNIAGIIEDIRKGSIFSVVPSNNKKNYKYLKVYIDKSSEEFTLETSVETTEEKKEITIKNMA